MSTVARLTTSAVDQRIAVLRSTLDRTTARLVDVDADVTRRLLETSQQIRGATAAAWADASRRHTALWQGQFALESLLTRVTEERGARRSAPQWVLVRLEGLLDGASVEFPRPAGNGALRLTEETTPTVACSVNEALELMSTDFDAVTEFLGAVAVVWGEFTERLHEVATVVAELEREVETAGIRRPNDLDLVARATQEAEALAREDPLMLGPEEIASLETRAQDLQARVHEASRERQASEESLQAADRSVGLGLEKLTAFRAQVEVWSEKILVLDSTSVALDALARELEGLGLECARARSLQVGPSADSLRSRGERLCEEVTQLIATEGARMARRDELRGLLEAYRAKAGALGLAENREIEAQCAAALETLYVAPCNVEEAEHRVTELQRAIRRLQGTTS